MYFQITVHYVLIVEITNALQGLNEKLECLGLRKHMLIVLVAEQVPIICVFHYHVDAVVLEEGVPQLYYLRVVQPIVQPDLSLHQLHLALRGHLVEVNLDGVVNTILTAYMRQVCLCLANFTVPKLPHPIFLL